MSDQRIVDADFTVVRGPERVPGTETWPQWQYEAWRKRSIFRRYQPKIALVPIAPRREPGTELWPDAYYELWRAQPFWKRHYFYLDWRAGLVAGAMAGVMFIGRWMSHHS